MADIDFNPRKVASSRLGHTRKPIDIIVAAQEARISKLTDRIGALMSRRVDEEEMLAEMLAMHPGARAKEQR